MRLSPSLSELVSLSLPVTVSRIGLLLLVVTDLAMTGHRSSDGLAALGLALGTLVLFTVFGVGMMSGTSILISQAIGAGRKEQCGAIWRAALKHGLLLGIVFVSLSNWSEDAFLLANQGPSLAAEAGEVLWVAAWGTPAVYMYVATVMFLEASGHQKFSVIAMIVANLLNIFLNWVMIDGHFGLPAMGASGAMLSTVIVRWTNLVLLIAYLFWCLDGKTWGLFRPTDEETRVSSRFRRLGYPIALTYSIESGAFTVLSIIAGMVGSIHIAAYQIAINLLQLIYMMPLGIATAVAILVGRAVGRADVQDVRKNAILGVCFCFALVLLVALVCGTMPRSIAGLYSGDPEILAIARVTIALASVVLIFDGLKEVFAGALRGTGDVWFATITNVIAFWLIMIPLGYFLSIGMELGAKGLLAAVTTSAMAAGLALGFRFFVMLRRSSFKAA